MIKQKYIKNSFFFPKWDLIFKPLGLITVRKSWLLRKISCTVPDTVCDDLWESKIVWHYNPTSPDNKLDFVGAQ